MGYRNSVGEVVDRPPAITIYDVAREARVGESTVSRVLRGQGAVSEKARERVLSAVRKLGYVPNRIAGTLASSGSRLVALVIPSVTNNVFGDVLAEASATLTGLGHQAVFAVTDYDQSAEENLIESMLAWRPAGIIVAGIEHAPRALAMLRGSGIRIAEILDTDSTGIDIVVGYSNTDAGRTSARFLLSRGKQRIGYVGHDLSRDLRAGKRYGGFCQTLADGGSRVVDSEIVPELSSIEMGRNSLAKLLERTPDLDAVYFSNDDLAIGGLFHCMSHGIAVPERLALMGYNGLDAVRLVPRPLSTIRTPRRLIGQVAARLVCSEEPSQVVDVGFELIEGATV
ncbi:LacI family DNA-binding transcriptional regulator [Telmatospirillum sp.]|uniref:LacI family DNA-binding transcriptional regulator n=1 Tax=Telmatospirillum sp. TaxID=2079197 RepID=UPI00283C5031|nr:LacI family DNA-binding transcriptional regulator [Telmatospirillum sp.]MDR3438844.1 LacI family DNA-binding transcriptional regulator [Telmatospirillum sp.]